jgi:hypothetical protein
VLYYNNNSICFIESAKQPIPQEEEENADGWKKSEVYFDFILYLSISPFFLVILIFLHLITQVTQLVLLSTKHTRLALEKK